MQRKHNHQRIKQRVRLQRIRPTQPRSRQDKAQFKKSQSGLAQLRLSPLYLVGPISLVLFIGLAIGLLLPTTTSEAEAASCKEDGTNCDTEQLSAQIKAKVGSTINLALDAEVSLEATPDNSASTVVTKPATLTVSTNNATGYKLYLSATNVTDNQALLTNTNAAITASIKPVEGTVTAANFPANSWGYSLDGTNYQAVPASAEIIRQTEALSSDTYSLSFGVAINNQLPAGQYTNSVVVSAVANTVKISNLSQLIYMQDMTPEVCANTKDATGNAVPTTGSGVSLQGTPFETVAIDERDGKEYRVAKLKDGHCWMTSDLALSLDSNKPLTPADSDVTESRTLPTTLTSVTDNRDTNGTVSWHLAKDTPSTNGNALDTDRWYYQWNTAVAGTGTNLSSGSAKESICPKGWKLPINGEYGTLINTAYGIPSATYGTNVDAKLLQQPLNFIRGGYVWTGTFYDAGVSSIYWSATTGSDTNTYTLHFYASYLNPSGSDSRAGGFALRCVAR